MSRGAVLGLLGAVALALMLRLPGLEQRPFHTDESVHAVKFLGLWEGRGYRYDPHEYHGPSLYYATLPFAWFSGARTGPSLGEAVLRLVPVCFGIGLILLLPLLREAIGQAGALVAGVLTAVSPAFVFYSRYYIHEVLLVFFTLFFLGSAWRYWKSGAWGWAVAAGAALGLMFATKETFVFVLAVVPLAAFATAIWERWVPSPADPDVGAPPVSSGQCPPLQASAPPGEGTSLWAGWRRQALARWRWGHVAALVATALTVSLVLFTSCFTNWQGPLDSVKTYLPWFGRAGGDSPHIHPWTFYLQRLGWYHVAKGPVWSEALILGLAVAGWGAALWGRKPRDGRLRFVRFLGFYAFGLTGIYCLIPYKTPWCALGFHHAFILLAGAGVAVLWQALSRVRLVRVVVFLALGAAVAQLGGQAWRGSTSYATDRRNPYVYAHTSRDLLRLVETIRAITQYGFQGKAEVIKVIAPGGDYWPLPWYLRQYEQVGWYPAIPDDPYASLMIVGSRFQADLDERSEKKWLMVGLFEHRPQVFFELYVAFEVWKRYIELRPRPKDDD